MQSQTNASSGRNEGRVADLSSSYSCEVAASIDTPPEVSTAATIVIVTYRSDPNEFKSVLDAVDDQTVQNVETIIVDNGNDWPVERMVGQFDSVTGYVQLRRNCGVTVGRNLGAHLASSDLVVFLDDDAVPGHDFVAAHQRAHEGNVLGVRGRVVTREDTFYNRRQSWYDLGDESRPYHLNTEGNSSYDRETFLSVGGFNETLVGRAGHEGSELTYRLVDAGYDREQFIYHPDPVIYHDVDSAPLSYLKKRVVRRYYKRRLLKKRPRLWEFIKSYDPPQTDTSAFSLRDHFLAYAFSAASLAGCKLLELRDRATESVGAGSRTEE